MESHNTLREQNYRICFANKIPQNNLNQNYWISTCYLGYPEYPFFPSRGCAFIYIMYPEFWDMFRSNAYIIDELIIHNTGFIGMNFSGALKFIPTNFSGRRVFPFGLRNLEKKKTE